MNVPIIYPANNGKGQKTVQQLKDETDLVWLAVVALMGWYLLRKKR